MAFNFWGKNKKDNQSIIQKASLENDDSINLDLINKLPEEGKHQNMHGITIDEASDTLKLNPKLMEELHLLYKLAEDSNVIVDDCRDIKALCQYAINAKTIREEYYLSTSNLNAIIRACVLAEINGTLVQNSEASNNNSNMMNIEDVTADTVSDLLELDDELRECMDSLFQISRREGMTITDWKSLMELCNYVNQNEELCKEYIIFPRVIAGIQRAIVYAQANDYTIRSIREDGIIDNENASYDVTTLASGEAFEKYCANLLKRNGYENVEVTLGSGDHGIDIIAEKDFVTYAIQCKYYSSPVGNRAIQEAFSGKQIYGKDIAVVMTNNVFTKQATDDAKKLGVKLWDKNILEKMNNK